LKSLLIQPAGTREVRKDFVSVQYPINLGYIAAVLKKDGHVIRMMDFNVVEYDSVRFRKFILEFEPLVVGFTSMTSTINEFKRLCSEVKGINEKIITVLGGVHASALPIQTLEETPDLDIIVFGEGEITVCELYGCIQEKKDFSKIKGISFRKDNRIVKNEERPLIKNLDDIPKPDRDLLPMEMYAKAHVSRGFSRRELKIVEIITSRGCPYSCIFCAGHINYKHKLRFRSYSDIADEIDECIRKYNVNHVSIEDDTFTINRELVTKLCSYFYQKRITWSCNSRVDTVDYPLLKIMSKSGCKKISFGIESGSPRILKLIKKGITVPQAKKALRDARKARIRYVEGTFMLGSHIDETMEDIQKTEKLIKELMPDFAGLFVMCPFPGTEIFETMKKEKLIEDRPDWNSFTFFGNLRRYERLNHLTVGQLNQIQRDFLRKYYFSFGYIFRQILRIRGLRELRYFCILGIAFFKEFLFQTNNKIVSRQRNLETRV